MPGIGGDDSAANVSADAGHSLIENFLDDDYAGSDEKREWRWKVMRIENLPNRHDRDSYCRAEQHQRHHGGGDWLRFTMTVWVILVCRSGSDAQAHPHDQRRENIRRRFNGIGHERVGVSDDASNEFDQHE